MTLYGISRLNERACAAYRKTFCLIRAKFKWFLHNEQQTALITHLLERSKQRDLSVDEKISLLRASQLYAPVNQTPSPKREDWYDE